VDAGSPVKIWLAPSAFAPHRGGVEELTLKMAQHLIAAGDEVLVVTNQHPSSLPSMDTVEGVAVRRVAFTVPGRRPSSLIRHARRLRSIQAGLDQLGPTPDVVHVICPSSQLAPLEAWARHHDVPVVITSQGETAMDAGRLYQRSGWMRRQLRRSATRAAALTSCSEWAALAAAKVAPPFAASTVIPNGVDVADWANMSGRPAEPVVAAWGRHVPQKGFDLLLNAWPSVIEEIPAARLLLGGSGPETERLRGLAPPSVQLLGSLDRDGVRSLLESARIAVTPSRIEPFGIVAVEALAAGRGLVYSAGTGLAEAAGPCGRAAAVEDPHELAAAIVSELRDPEPLSRARAQAERLSWSNLSGRYRDLFSTVVEHGR
jgi:glycogen(starch) synthase